MFSRFLFFTLFCSGAYSLPIISLVPLSSTSPSTATLPASSSATPTSTESASSTSSASPAATTDSNPKYVVAHHMVGNTFPYTIDDWATDMELASSSGIDGFALNFGRDDFQNTQLDNAYEAAKKYPDFRLFLSMDMTSLPCASSDDAQSLRTKVLKYVDHPNQLKANSRAFVSTFAGETCSFGQSGVPEGWKSQFTKHSELDGKITFVPAFFADPSQFSQFAEVMDGDFNWNAGWPITLTTDQVKSAVSQATQESTNGTQFKSLLSSSQDANDDPFSQLIGGTESDEQHLQALASIPGGISRRDGESDRIYMAPVSPWFFTHFGQDTFNKNFMYLADEHLYARRWENVIASRESINIVQLLTWNDWGESSYLSPVKGALPTGSEQWVNGMPHEGFLEVTKYYAEAFKTGQTPSISNDTIVLYSRPHPVNADAPDPVGRPKSFDLAQDKMWAIVLLKEAGQVKLSTSTSNSQTFDLQAGISKLSIQINAGDSISGAIQRNGQDVLTTPSNNFTFNGSPSAFNFNAFVLSASA